MLGTLLYYGFINLRCSEPLQHNLLKVCKNILCLPEREGVGELSVLPQDHEAMPLARTRAQTARYGDERTNYENSAPTGWGEKTVVPESQTLHRKVKVPWPVPSHAAVQGFERLMLAVYRYNYGASTYDK